MSSDVWSCMATRHLWLFYRNSRTFTTLFIPAAIGAARLDIQIRSVGFQGFIYTPGILYRETVRVHVQSQSSLLAPLSEVAEPCHQEELLQEELGVQDSDVGCTANQRVGRVGQSVEHILSDQPALFSLHNRLQEVVDHFCVHGPFRWHEHS